MFNAMSVIGLQSSHFVIHEKLTAFSNIVLVIPPTLPSLANKGLVVYRNHRSVYLSGHIVGKHNLTDTDEN